MYEVKSNDGDTWIRPSIEEAVVLIKEGLENSAKEEETKRHNSFEVYWVD